MSDDMQLSISEAPDARLPLSARFEQFHATNPHVYAELAMLARRAKRTGASKVGIANLWEVLRWRHMLSTRGDEYTLNNDFRAGYARLLMEREPDLSGLFETRRSAMDRVV